MNSYVKYVGGAVATIAAVFVGFVYGGVYAHNNTNALEAMLKGEPVCQELGPPSPSGKLTPFIRNAYQCGALIVVIPK